MNNSKSQILSTAVPSAEEFLKDPGVPAGRFFVSIDGHKNEFYFQDNGRTTTVVLFESRLNDKFVSASAALSQKLEELQQVNLLLVKDPGISLSDSPGTWWFLGSSKQPSLVKSLNGIFIKIIGENRAIYSGESDGGFAALLFASLHPMALALPVNPQVYLDPLRLHSVQEWLESAWKDSDRSVGRELLNEYGDVSSIYAEPHRARVVYVQNKLDNKHFEEHYKLFKSIARPQVIAGVSLVEADNGHVPLSTDFLSRVVEYIASLEFWGRVDLQQITKSYSLSYARTTEVSNEEIVGTRRDTSRYKGAGITEFDDMDSFLSSPVTSGMSSFDYHGKPFDLLVRRKPNASTTIIVFHPAAAGDKITRPFFVGTTLTDKLPVNAVFIADPSLEWDDNLRISWFAGNRHQPLQQDLPRILSHVITELGTKNVIFYGASAGGFAALYYSSLFSNSLAIAINPQTKITGYGKDFVAKYCEVCWEVGDAQEAIRSLKNYVIEDLSAHYERVQPNYVLYMQNETDWHLGVHMTPFVNRFNERNKLMKIVGMWGDGHVPPQVEYQEEVLKLAVESNGDWLKIAAAHDDCNL